MRIHMKNILHVNTHQLTKLNIHVPACVESPDDVGFGSVKKHIMFTAYNYRSMNNHKEQLNTQLKQTTGSQTG